MGALDEFTKRQLGHLKSELDLVSGSHSRGFYNLTECEFNNMSDKITSLIPSSSLLEPSDYKRIDVPDPLHRDEMIIGWASLTRKLYESSKRSSYHFHVLQRP